MVPRLLGSLVVLGVFPVYLALRGVPSMLEFVALAWMIAPISTACFLSRTGRYDVAQGLFAFALTSIVTIVAVNSGGINSFAAIWLVLIPLEAALSGSRRVVAVAASLAACGAGLLVLADSWFDLGSGAERSTGVLATLGIFSALLYATGIAFGADTLKRASVMGLSSEAEPCERLAFSRADVVTHHGDGGRIVRASTNAQAVLGGSAEDLQGYGLFDRIHVGDRPAYLRALSEAASTGEACEIEFRLRRSGQAEFIWIEMRCRPCNGKHDRAEANPEVVAVMRDVTVRKASQDALIASGAETARANAATGRFPPVRSRELRAPLNTVIGLSGGVSTPDPSADPSADRPAITNCPADLLLPVQRRA